MSRSCVSQLDSTTPSAFSGSPSNTPPRPRRRSSTQSPTISRLDQLYHGSSDYETKRARGLSTATAGPGQGFASIDPAKHPRIPNRAKSDKSTTSASDELTSTKTATATTTNGQTKQRGCLCSDPTQIGTTTTKRQRSTTSRARKKTESERDRGRGGCDGPTVANGNEACIETRGTIMNDWNYCILSNRCPKEN